MGLEGLISVAHNVLSKDNEYFNIYIDGVDDQVFSLQTAQLNDVVQSISSLLAKAGTRAVGVRLLNKYLDQCSTDVFTRTGNLWTSLVLKSCQGQQDCSDAYEALGKLALKSLQTPELTKTFATTHLSKVYECLTNPSSSCVVSAIKCMENCLRLYPSASGPSKRMIEKFLSRFHDSLDNNVISYTGKCLHLLQQVSGGEAQSSNHKTLWKNYQIQLVGSIHEVFDSMFVHCTEMWDDNVVQEKLLSMEKMELSPEPISKAAQLYVRAHNLISYFITALKEPFPVEKPLLPRIILGVISRGLGVNCNLLHQYSITDNIALALLLPKIHLDLLHLLDAAIIVLRGHLLPYYNQILNLLMEVMKSTAEDENYATNQKPFRRLRAKVYDTLSLWCKVHNAGSRCEAITDQLFQELLIDITPKTNELTLQVTKAVSKHTSKKMKRQMQKVQNDRSKIAQSSFKSNRTLNASYNDEQNQLLCTAALKCIQAVLTSAASFIKPTKIKLMQSSVIHICGNFYELPMDAGQLYGNSQCRLEIYNTLYVFMTTPHHLSPPPADILLTLLNAASYRDGNTKVRGQCFWILQNLEKIIHPQKESLGFPIDSREIRNTFIMMGQEKLLGQAENVFSNDLNEDDTDEEQNEIELENPKDMEIEEKSQDIDAKNTQAIDDVNVVLQSAKETKDNSLESPFMVSDSLGDRLHLMDRCAVEISSEDDDSVSLRLRMDDQDSEQDDVEIISVEPVNKRSKMEEKEKKNMSTTDGENETSIDVEQRTEIDLTKTKTIGKNPTKDTEDLIINLDEDALEENIEPVNKKSKMEEEQKKNMITTDGENAISIDVEEEAAAESAKTETVGENPNTSLDDFSMNLDEDTLVENIAAQFVDDLA